MPLLNIDTRISSTSSYFKLEFLALRPISFFLQNSVIVGEIQNRKEVFTIALPEKSQDFEKQDLFLFCNSLHSMAAQ